MSTAFAKVNDLSMKLIFVMGKAIMTMNIDHISYYEDPS